MFGNAVCPPLIAVLSGAVLEQCQPHRRHASNHEDWGLRGLDVGIQLALESILPARRDAVLRRLQTLGITEAC